MATITYKCPNCSGDLVFDPGSGKFKCEYCMSEFTKEQLDALADAAKDQKQPEEDAEDGAGSAGETGAAAAGTVEEAGATAGAAAGAAGAGATAGAAGVGAAGAGATGSAGTGEAGASRGSAVIYTCPSCGAEIVADETTAATFCFYCHNPVVLSSRLSGELQPDVVIPFAIDKKKAQQIFTQWIGQKKFVPKSFYTPKQIESMTGVYFPYWLYDCKVDGKLKGTGTVQRVWDAAGMRYTERKIYQVNREGTMNVNHVTRNALKKASKQLSENVLPFQMDGLQAFNMGYLSGFVAEKRDLEKGEFTEGVEQEVKQYAISSLMANAGSYSSFQPEIRQANIRDARWSYGLLPVWTLTYQDKANKKVYYFALNGQTGKTCGELPVDKNRLTLLFFEIFIPFLILLLIGGYFL